MESKIINQLIGKRATFIATFFEESSFDSPLFKLTGVLLDYDDEYFQVRDDDKQIIILSRVDVSRIILNQKSKKYAVSILEGFKIVNGQ